MNSASTRVYIVEDSPPIRERLDGLLGAIDGVEIVGHADTPGDAIAGILSTHPHCVVLDYQLIGGTGVEVLRALHPISPATAFVVMTNHPGPQYRRVCLSAGASAFLDKSTEFEKIVDFIADLGPTPN
jgi:two-component system response regulator DevR